MASYEIGQIVFSEGDRSDYVGYIVDGEAEVCKRHGDSLVTVGRLKAGEYFGEMAALEGREHGATVRAAGSLTVECFEKSSFLERASRDSDLALGLLKTLSRRLRQMDDAYAAAVEANKAVEAIEKGPESDGAAGTTKLLAGSGRVAAAVPPEGLVLKKLPFVVGRTPSDREGSSLIPIDLSLDDQKPYRLSRSHFSIGRENGRMVVHDLHSHLGTQVNDTFIGQFFAHDTAELTAGENVIVAGGEGSPYKFRVVV